MTARGAATLQDVRDQIIVFRIDHHALRDTQSAIQLITQGSPVAFIRQFRLHRNYELSSSSSMHCHPKVHGDWDSGSPVSV
jgi:hypothetical protein